ncbi:MAG: zinc-binding dehydrogenase, partial [Gemmatimonadales bacterium]
AHQSQCHAVPEDLSDEAAVMVEPAACAVHAALRARIPDGALVVVMGAGTLGLCVVAALRRLVRPGTLVSAAKHPDQAALARELGADMVVAPSELSRSVRRATRTLAVGKRLAGGADVVIDCVGTGRSIGQALSIARPGGRVVLAGMPGVERVDLAPLWQREVDLVGAYAYGEELLPGGRWGPDNPNSPDGTTGAVRTFELAFDLVGRAELGRLVSARYPLEGYREALAHAAAAGKRGSVKVVFDLRRERERRG